MKKFIIIIVSIFLILVFILSPFVMAQTPPEATITIEGQLVNATPGGTAGAGIPLMLHIYDGQQMVDMIHDVMTGPEGTFRFEDVQVVEGRFFAVMATAGQTTYFSELVPVSPGQATLELPVTIYDSTTDDSAIRVEQMYLMVEFLGLTQMQVTEIYIIANDGDRTVEEAVTLDDGQTASLRFTLPDGATGLSFERNNANGRFTHTVDGFADTWGVPPGPGVFQSGVKYLLPYQDGLRLERTLSYPTDNVNVMLPRGGVSLTGDTLTSEGSRQQDGQTVDIFTAADLRAGQPFVIELNGQPEFEGRPGISSTGSASSSSTLPESFSQQKIGRILVIVGLAVLGLVFIGGGVWRWRQETEEDADDLDSALAIDPEIAAEVVLIRTIAELDDDYQAGDLPAESYLSRRRDLRAELKALLAEHQPDPNDPESFDEQAAEISTESSDKQEIETRTENS